MDVAERWDAAEGQEMNAGKVYHWVTKRLSGFQDFMLEEPGMPHDRSHYLVRHLESLRNEGEFEGMSDIEDDDDEYW